MRTVAWFLAAIVLTALLAACGDSVVGLSCTDPAPLTGTPSGASPLYFVSLIEGADVVAETHRMELTHGFIAYGVYDFARAFAADLTASRLMVVRCDAAVAAVHRSGTEAGLSCDNPAPLHREPESGPRCSVQVVEGADLFAETHRMEIAYGFTATSISEYGPWFDADLTPSQLSLLLCDDAVESAYYPRPLYPQE